MTVTYGPDFCGDCGGSFKDGEPKDFPHWSPIQLTEEEAKKAEKALEDFYTDRLC